MTKRVLIFQYYEGELHRDMIGVARERHEQYARRWNYDYRITGEQGPIVSAFGWLRWDYLYGALTVLNYDVAIFLETDTMIEHTGVDLVDALRSEYRGDPGDCMAMVYGSGGGEPMHYQTGVIYAQRHPRTIAFLEAMLHTRPDPDVPEGCDLPWWQRKHCQQTVANDLLTRPEYAGLVRKLDPPWNNVYPDRPCIVRAWHGIPGESRKMQLMRDNLAVVVPRERKPRNAAAGA